MGIAVGVCMCYFIFCVGYNLTIVIATFVFILVFLLIMNRRRRSSSTISDAPPFVPNNVPPPQLPPPTFYAAPTGPPPVQGSGFAPQGGFAGQGQSDNGAQFAPVRPPSSPVFRSADLTSLIHTACRSASWPLPQRIWERGATRVHPAPAWLAHGAVGGQVVCRREGGQPGLGSCLLVHTVSYAFIGNVAGGFVFRSYSFFIHASSTEVDGTESPGITLA